MRRLALAAGLLAVLIAAGCGLGPGNGAAGARVTVTSNFGAASLGERSFAKTPGDDTVIRLLERSFRVTTRFGGGFVQSINGLAGGIEGGKPVDWFYYVNGIEAKRGSASTTVHAGDRIWWDRHDWSATNTIPAVVGSYPEPFRSGIGGHRLPVVISCARQSQSACQQVRSRLSAAGVAVSTGLLGSSPGNDTLRVIVGPLAAIGVDHAASLLAGGPASSGVYARPVAGGSRLAVLDPSGRAVRTLAGATGLLAATRDGDQQPTWFVTGTDAAGVDAAAGALDEGDLGNHLALAISNGGAVPLPAIRAR